MHYLLFFFIFFPFIINYSFLFGTENTIGPFQFKSKKIKNFSELAYSIEKYVTPDKKYYANVKQSFPQQITTNFFIHAEKKFKDDPSYYENTIAYIKKDKKSLVFFLKNFLGVFDKKLSTEYMVYENTIPNVPTIIECCCDDKDGNKNFRFFSQQYRLAGRYDTHFDWSYIIRDQLEPEEDEYKIFLYHLDDLSKKRVIQINKWFKIESVFLEKYFLVVGSFVYKNFIKAKNKYHIDIYTAEEFCKYGDMPLLDGEIENLNSEQHDVAYFLSIDIEKQNMTNEEKNAFEPIFKLLTILDDQYCILYNQATGQSAKISFLDNQTSQKVIIDDLTIIYNTNNPTKQREQAMPSVHLNPISSSDSKKINPTTHKKRWLQNNYVKIGVATISIATIVMLFIFAYSHKKGFPIFYSDVS